jgi:thiosulfate reductase cytochrome b subunit
MSTSARATQRGGWFNVVVIVVIAIVMLAAVVLIARWLRTLDPVQSFLHDFPGQSDLPANAPVGIPAWLGWQHFLSAFFLVLIIRTGWLVRTTKRPAAYWTRRNSGLIRTKNPPKKLSLDIWLHFSLDGLWVLNGIVFFVLIFVTGQWVRIVPTRWDVVPNAISTAIQYASLNWPTESGWTNYNALQLLSYFVVVFIAAPLAILTGLRMSPVWPTRTTRLNRVYRIEIARALHFPIMLFFVLFLIAHVTLVLATGALRNLNHMYAARNDDSWAGFWIFAASLVVMAAAFVLARTIFIRPLASLTGTVSR